jgi:hypothetical protein
MAVSEIAGALGEWGVSLKPDTPQEILDKLGYFGHVAISAAHVDPTEYGDALLSAARYVGVNLQRSFGDDNKKIGGQSMAYWLGDGEDKGQVIEDPLNFTTATFVAAFTDLLPTSLQPGTIHAQTGTYTKQVKFQTPRVALDYLCSLFDCEWRVNGDGTVDAGQIPQLFVTNPQAAILRNRHGLEMDFRALRGRGSLDSDVKDFTTRVVLLAQDQETGSGTVSAATDILPQLNPYVDLFGNPVKITRIIEETETDPGNAPARAQLQLNRFTSPRDSLKLTTTYYDIRGDITPGDYVWVWDPEARLENPANSIDFQGQEIQPMKLRVFRLSWPIERGMGVAFRSPDGSWVDLTPWVMFENGETDVVVGGYNRSLTSASGPIQQPGSSNAPNTTIPGQVQWSTTGTQVLGFGSSPFGSTPFGAGTEGGDLYDFLIGTYQNESTGMTEAQLVLKWAQPLNTDNSVIQDGAYYEINYRTSNVATFPVTHADMAAWRHNTLTGQERSPIPFTLGAWQTMRVAWGNTQALVMGLQPGIPYDFRIRLVDTGVPANTGVWSETATVTTLRDSIAPKTPAACEVASSPAALQIIHYLGVAEGGTFNLPMDLNHLKVFVGTSHEFATNDLPVDQEGGTLAGKITANQGMIRGQIPAVATMNIRSTTDVWVRVSAVDNDGNESAPSQAVQAKADLIDDAYISRLSVSKVAAGTILSDWLIGAKMATGTQGARVELAWYGLHVYNMQNLRTLTIDSQTGSISMIGTVQTGVSGRRVIISGEENEILFMPENGETRKARIFSYIPSNYPNDIVIELRSIDSDTSDYRSRAYLLPDRVDLTLSPQGEGGDLLGKSGVRVSKDSVAVHTSQITGVSGAFSQKLRAQVWVADDGTVEIGSWDETGGSRAQAVFTNTEISVEKRTAGQRDGGYFWLRPSDQGTYFGHRKRDGSVDRYFRMDPTEIAAVYDTRTFWSMTQAKWTQVVDGFVRLASVSDGTEVWGTTYTSRVGGIKNGRVVYKTDDNNRDVFWYMNGGTVALAETFDRGQTGTFVKNFVIPHPTAEDKWLVHGCTESPWAGVEYWGEATVEDGEVTVPLPEYFEDFTYPDRRNVQVTVVAERDPKDREKLKRRRPRKERPAPPTDLTGRVLAPPRVPPGRASLVQATYPEAGEFTIFAEGPVETFRVFWLVKAVRKNAEFPVEPLKSEVNVYGEGPYRFLEEK